MLGSDTEHFVTLFDQGYLPQGLCLHQSLTEHAGDFHLWVLCMDDEALESLEKLKLKNVTGIPLNEGETEALLKVKPTRTRGEYNWTLTPFTCQMIFDRVPEAKRATYLDADLFFFSSPQPLFQELEESGKDVLITEHAYAPEYDQTEQSGTYCVQFMTFNNNDAGKKVMTWWQDRCLEWCHAYVEDGKFGDQKYLDVWPELFAKEVHVLQNKELALGPWNVQSLLRPDAVPVFYHFHGLRVLSTKQILLFSWYRIGMGQRLYDTYLKRMRHMVALMNEKSLSLKSLPIHGKQKIKVNLFRLLGRAQLGRF